MNSNHIWIGIDPGGKGKFGVAIIGKGLCHVRCVDYVDAAIQEIQQTLDETPSGIGVDAPLWWSSGPNGLRKADERIRKKYHLPNRNVQAVNSMWGSVLVQGMMFVQRIREIYPNVSITEVHPKVVFNNTLGVNVWSSYFAQLNVSHLLSAKGDDERDAVIAAIAARESFEGRWIHDLSLNRFSSEQNPANSWLGPVNYFWPEDLP